MTIRSMLKKRESLNKHAGRNPKRISLPTYPFETSSYWIPEVGKVIANDKNRAVVFSEQEDPCEHSENILSSNKSTEAYSEPYPA